MYINVNNNESHQRKTTCTFSYIQKEKQIAKSLYIYIQIQTLFKKQDNLRYVFIHKNPDTLRYTVFDEIFEIGIYIFI